MRHMSFSLTTAQVRDRTKSVTRRLGWADLKPGERLNKMTDQLFYGIDEVMKEGFEYSYAVVVWPTLFVRMFCAANKCRPSKTINRIEFKYV